MTTTMQSMQSVPSYNPNPNVAATETPNIGKCFTSEVNLAHLESASTFTFVTAPRTDKAGNKSGNDLKVILPKPAFLTASTTITDPATKNIYEYGALELFKNHIRKLVKDYNIVAGMQFPTESLTLQHVLDTAFNTSRGARTLSKVSITEELESHLAEFLTTSLLAKGLPDEKVLLGVAKLSAILISLSAPGTKLDDNTKDKLATLLESAQQTPVVTALIAKCRPSPVELDVNVDEFL